MGTIHLSRNLDLSAELAGRRTAVFGISGSGKSNTATVIIEGLLACNEQVVGIDPKGEMWGLLSTTSGKPSNLPLIVFGEPNGHIETLSETHGPRLADFVVETGRSVVLSLLGFESDQSERRFVASFLRQLYRRKSRQGQPTRTLVVMEESHLFCPEQVRGDAAELAGAVQRIARQGRSFGIGTLLIDQRPQDVSKRVISQCDTLICHQLVHKTDRDALREWVRGYDVDGRGEQFLDSLASLEPGEAWVWSPAWLKLFQRVHVNRRKTFDSGAAPDGSAAARTIQRADVNLDELRGQLAEIVDKAKADDPRELRKRIADLERQLREKPAPVAQEAKVERVEVQVLSDGDFEHLEQIAHELRSNAEQIGSTFGAVMEKLGRLQAKPAPARPQVAPRPARVAPVPKAPLVKKRDEQPAADYVAITQMQQRILDALAWYESLGNHAPTLTQIGAVACIDPTGGYFRNMVGPLSAAGVVIREHGALRLTDFGRAVANVPESVGTLDDYHEVLRKRVAKMRSAGGKTIEMLNVVIAAAGEDLTLEQLGEAVGVDHTGGYFRNMIGPLSTAGLIERRSGMVRPTEVLFPPGLA